MAETRAHPGLLLGVGRFFHDPRGSVRAMLESGPSEARLLAYAMIAVTILLIGRIALLLNEGLDPETLAALVSGQLVSLLFFVPLAYYGLAAIGTLIARRFGGQGGWREGRAAFFWAALVSAPIVVLSSIADAMLSASSRLVADVAGQIGGLFFAWAVAICFAETFGFHSIWRVLAVICLPIILLITGLSVMGN